MPQCSPVRTRRLALIALGTLAACCALACGGQELPPRADQPDPSVRLPEGEVTPHAPCLDRDPLRRPFFGDTHVHTAFSFDASAQDTRNTPRDAYRFAKGEPMGIQPYTADGEALRQIRLDRPLDFAAVTDHAELLGEVEQCMRPGNEGYSSWVCWVHRNWPAIGFQLISSRTLIDKTRWSGVCGDDDGRCLKSADLAWIEIQRAAEEAYDRSPACSFTSFVGYEWTATVGEGENLHRNVIFESSAVPDTARSWVDTPSAVDLWDDLQKTCVDGKPGCDVLTIPHNSNLSGGLMFESARVSKPGDFGLEVDADERARRPRFEPLVEIMQHKGDSECMITPGSGDEACGFEKLPYDRFGAKFSSFATNQPATPAAHVRGALGRGLEQHATLGANSLKFGIIAATDTHIAAPGLTREKDHPGHGGAGMGQGESLAVGFPDDLEFGPGGLSVLWAEENTRESLFAAMMRREAYGTSGTRPVVRFFCGWGYDEALCSDAGFVETGYASGVPMGADLPSMPAAGAAPRFAFRALRDAGSATAPGTPLQRLQVIKVWLEDGAVKEKVYDVAGGENGASVDLDTCQARGDGADELCTVWTDPDFDPRQHALWYGRVLENPTCRWSQYVCLEAQIDCSDAGSVPDALAACCTDAHRAVASQQERAWTSPIWYTPPAGALADAKPAPGL